MGEPSLVQRLVSVITDHVVNTASASIAQTSTAYVVGSVCVGFLVSAFIYALLHSAKPHFVRLITALNQWILNNSLDYAIAILSIGVFATMSYAAATTESKVMGTWNAAYGWAQAALYEILSTRNGTVVPLAD